MFADFCALFLTEAVYMPILCNLGNQQIKEPNTEGLYKIYCFKPAYSCNNLDFTATLSYVPF